MERLRSMTLVPAALVLALGSGCIHVHMDGDGKVKSVTTGTPDGVTPAKAETKAAAKPDPMVKPAAATLPTAGLVTKLAAKPSKNQATEIGVAWQNRLAYLPDPSKNGALGVGLVGQMFLFGPNLQFVPAEGKLTVDLYDETPRTPGAAVQPVLMERWQIDRDTLNKLVTVDERIGKSYALFLPWPSYRADIVRVRLTARYDTDGGHTLYAPASTLTIDTSVPGSGGPVPGVPAGGFAAAPAGTPPMGPVVGPTPGNIPLPASLAPASGYSLTPTGPNGQPLRPPQVTLEPSGPVPGSSLAPAGAMPMAPMMPAMPAGAMPAGGAMPMAPAMPASPVSPAGALFPASPGMAPGNPGVPPGLPPLAITVPRR